MPTKINRKKAGIPKPVLAQHKVTGVFQTFTSLQQAVDAMHLLGKQATTKGVATSCEGDRSYKNRYWSWIPQ